MEWCPGTAAFQKAVRTRRRRLRVALRPVLPPYSSRLKRRSVRPEVRIPWIHPAFCVFRYLLPAVCTEDVADTSRNRGSFRPMRQYQKLFRFPEPRQNLSRFSGRQLLQMPFRSPDLWRFRCCSVLLICVALDGSVLPIWNLSRFLNPP